MTEPTDISSDKSLRHALSLHPRAFNVSSSSQRESSQARDSAPSLPDHIAISGQRNQGHSTSYEPTTPDDDKPDPIPRAIHGFGEDLERHGSLPQYTRENDPYALSSKLKTASEINLIKANTSKKRQNTNSKLGCLGPVAKSKGAWHAYKIGNFYESQNETIQQLLKPVDDHRREAKDSQGENQLRFKIAVRGSFLANVMLAGLQLYAASTSGSLSLFTTMADALFDPLSNVTLILSNRAVNRVDPRKFPSGKARIETAGNIVFCFLMTSVSFIIIVQSIVELTRGSHAETRSFHLPSVIAVAVAFSTKFCLFLYCWALRNKYSQIRILWEDHRNDLLINGFGLLTSIGGSKLKWWIDPMGAILLSCLIVFLWIRTAMSEFQLLIGVSAETQMLQLITYMCMFNLLSNDFKFQLTRASDDTLTFNSRNRHCPCLPQWASSHCRSRYCHVPGRHSPQHS